MSVCLGEFVIWVGGILLFGFTALAMVLVAAIFRFAAFVVRSIFGENQAAGDRRVRIAGRLVCPHPRCGHQNITSARYCARCGRALEGHADFDFYG